MLQKAAITDTSSLKRGFELVTCRQLILAALNYAGLREAGLCGGRWSDDKLGKPAEILRDRRQRELELSASRPTQSQTTEPQDAFEMREQHLNAFAIATRALKCVGLCERPGYVTGLFVDAAWNSAQWRLRTAL